MNWNVTKTPEQVEYEDDPFYQAEYPIAYYTMCLGGTITPDYLKTLNDPQTAAWFVAAEQVAREREKAK